MEKKDPLFKPLPQEGASEEKKATPTESTGQEAWLPISDIVAGVQDKGYTRLQQ